MVLVTGEYWETSELLVVPVGIGACAHADEGGDEDGEGGEGGNDSIVHFVTPGAWHSNGAIARVGRQSNCR